MPIKKMTTIESVMFFGFKALHYFLFIVFPIIKFGFTNWLIGYLGFAFMAGFLLAIVFQLAHAVDEADFPVPDSATGKLEDEWAIHQIRTTANFATDNKIISWFVGGLNFQVEHHLYPNISHVHYPEINKIVKSVCAEFGVKYNEYPDMSTAVASHAHYLKVMGRE
jgi:linoleoyl-CoA desaturase